MTKLTVTHVLRIHAAFVAAFSSPDVKAAMARQENVIAPTGPEEAARFFASEEDRYAKLVKKANVHLD